MMDTNLSQADVDRRTVLRGLGGLAVAGSLAGCATDGSGGDGGSGDGGSGDGGDGGGSNAEVDEYLSDTENYDGTIEDMTGQDEATVMVGAEGNGGGNYAFDPAAISVDTGTTVVWEWTGEGSLHNVAHEDGEFTSEQTDEEGFTFEHTFEEAGTYLYVCEPHAGLNMNGAVVVE